MTIRAFLACALSILLASSAASAEEVQNPAAPPDAQVVAEVGQRRVTKAELDNEFSRQFEKELPDLSEKQQHFLRRRLLERLIERELLIQAAAEKGLAPSSQEVDQFIQPVKRGFASEADFDAELAKGGLDAAAFQSGVRDDLAIKKYVEAEVFQTISAEEAEAERLFKEEPQRFTRPEEARARHILLRVSESAPPEETQARAQRAAELYEQARLPGSDFAMLARNHSEAPNRDQGGDLGFFTFNQLEPEFAKAAFALAAGEVSPPVRTRFGFHIIKLEEKRRPSRPRFEDIRPAAVKEVIERKQQRALEQHLRQLRKSKKVIVYYR